ncbi:MAG: 2-dehydropantoate 2-reductase [Thermoplasmata archaeon]|nr:2-dehydropantoate 2-reductase [Thermoplasmata archaeon]MCI4337730.1 2-dehydropantoate 2-reductase [Thermoplasmata archaeon]MCI4341879.1 2-dehydropantoate 2-reductase [Thermoplasmata archaeon]
MRVVVFGAGAVGQLFGARLLRAQHEILLVARTEEVVAIRGHGLRVEGETEGVFPVPAVDALIDGITPDVVLLTVKSFDVESAGVELGRRLRPVPPVLATQNGLGIESTLRRGLERGRAGSPVPVVVRAVHTIPVTRLGPGSIRQAGVGELVLGRPAPETEAAAADRFAELFDSAGFTVRRVSDIEREVWRKLLVNAAINPVTADHGIPNGQLANEPWRGQAEELLAEALQVSRAEGFDFSDEEAPAELWRVVRATAANRSSMLQDLRRGRPTEIEAISGELLRRGGVHGLKLPATERALERIRRRVRERAGPGT